MTNPFSIQNLIPTWAGVSEILKGDTPGHPFRGNQYQTMEGHTANDLSEMAVGLSKGEGVGSPAQAAGYHRELATGHSEIARQARAAGDERTAKGHDAAASRHRIAANEAEFQSGRYKGTARVAASASRSAETGTWPNSGQGITNWTIT